MLKSLLFSLLRKSLSRPEMRTSSGVGRGAGGKLREGEIILNRLALRAKERFSK